MLPKKSNPFKPYKQLLICPKLHTCVHVKASALLFSICIQVPDAMELLQI